MPKMVPSYDTFSPYTVVMGILLHIKGQSLRIPKGGNQNPYIEGQDNTMGKRKRTKGITTIYKTTKDRLTRASLETMGKLHTGAPQVLLSPP
jgi:hypothetical protein